MHTEYLSLLSVQCQFGVIWCIPVFDGLVSTFDLNTQGFFIFATFDLNTQEVYTLPVFFYPARDQAEWQCI